MSIKKLWTGAVAGLSSLMWSAYALAQNGNVSTTTTTTTHWYGNWIVWVGVAVFLVVVIALTNRGSRQT